MKYQIAWHPATRIATVQTLGDALPAGAANIGVFNHDGADEATDGLGIAENHVLYHHVRDALYKQSVQDMGRVRIDLDAT